MTTELVLLLAIYAFILLGAFLGPQGPGETFRRSGPRLAAKIERNIAIGHRFNSSQNGGDRAVSWRESDERGN